MFDSLRLGCPLIRNRNGSPKQQPKLWQPHQCTLRIPMGDDLHGRPVIRLGSSTTGCSMLLVIHQDHICGVSHGVERELVAFDFG